MWGVFVKQRGQGRPEREEEKHVRSNNGWKLTKSPGAQSPAQPGAQGKCRLRCVVARKGPSATGGNGPRPEKGCARAEAAWARMPWGTDSERQRKRLPRIPSPAKPSFPQEGEALSRRNKT